VTSSRDIPRTWHLRYLDERERQIDRERERERRGGGGGGSNVELDTKLRAGSSRTSLRRSLVASSRMRMLAYAIPYGPRTQPAAKHNFARVFLIQQKRATDVQIRRNWILTSTLSTYLSAMQETMQPHTRSFTFGISGVCATRALSSTKTAKFRANGLL